MKPEAIRKREIIGARIRRVCYLNLPKGPEGDFQERLIVVEMESGLKFTLEQENAIVDPQTGKGLIYPYSGSTTFEVVVDSAKDPNLNSPVHSVVLTHGWKNCVGIILTKSHLINSGIWYLYFKHWCISGYGWT